MTAYEIWDQINHFVMDTKMDDAVCNVIRDLQHEEKDDEIIINYSNFALE